LLGQIAAHEGTQREKDQEDCEDYGQRVPHNDCEISINRGLISYGEGEEELESNNSKYFPDKPDTYVPFKLCIIQQKASWLVAIALRGTVKLRVLKRLIHESWLLIWILLKG